MNDILKTGFILFVICFIAGLSLGAVHQITWPKIEEQKRLAKEEALKAVMPEATSSRSAVREKSGEYYEGLNNGVVVSVAKETSIKGYGGKITLIVGIGSDKKISGVGVLAHSETPGLGARAKEIKYGETEPWFLKQFKGKDAASLKVVKQHSTENIEAITGATITSEAVTRGVRQVMTDMREVIGP